ncbi:MAG: ligand-binding sensor domain-containing protein, partial [Phycisphaerae bacterium]
MKKAPMSLLQRWLSALAPGNLRDTLNKHSRMVNSIALLVILLVIADVAGWFGAAKQWLTSQGHSQRPPGPPQHNVYVRVLHCPARFITAMISDGGDGAWIAGEDSGIYHYQPDAQRHWSHYDKANSPGLISNHIYSLCLDAKGRLWAGTLRHGVCVFSGVKWQHYGLLNGPLGSHIFAIVENPYDKSVWICTESGVSIYHIAADSVGGGIGNTNPTRQFAAAGQWQYIPQAASRKPDDLTVNGLPPNPDCVAFNQQGVAFVGTQCNGLAIGYPPYKSWWMVKGPWKVPIRPFGKGLPSSLINAVVTGKHGRIYVGTDEGLAWNSRKNPFAFQYERGTDYAMKDKQLWHPPANFKMPPRAFLNRLLPADHITCLAVDSQGKLWLGTWHSGLWTNALRDGRRQGDIREMTPVIARFNAAWRAQRRQRMREAKLAKLRKASKTEALTAIAGSPALAPLPPHTRFQVDRLDISAILPLGDGSILIGHHCVGVSEARLSPPPSSWGRSVASLFGGLGRLLPGPSRPPNLPASAQAPSSNQLAALYRNLLKNPDGYRDNPPPRPQVVPITDDWRTQGSWLGRYGRYWACLFACVPPPDTDDYVWGPGPVALDHNEALGPHHRLVDNGPLHILGGDEIRCWVQRLATANHGVLELPEVYLNQMVAMGAATWKLDRRQAEIDNHGETYPLTWQGPNIYVYLHIPPGAYTLSLYFKDHHYFKDPHYRGMLLNRFYHMNRDLVISLIPLPASYQFGTSLQP